MKNKFRKNLHSRSLAFGSATDILLHIIIEFYKYFIIIIIIFFAEFGLDQA